MTRLPPEIYQIVATYPSGVGNVGDFTADFDDALDAFVSARDDGLRPRVFAVTFDVHTNAPETINDVTDEFDTAAEPQPWTWGDEYDRARIRVVEDILDGVA